MCLLRHTSLAQALFHVWKCTIVFNKASHFCYIFSASYSVICVRHQEPGQLGERETLLSGNTRTYKCAWTLVFLMLEMRLSAYVIFQILFGV